MEEWYSGGDTNSAAAAAVLGAPPATAGVAGKGYGDSFTPPTSRSGIIGGQVSADMMACDVRLTKRGSFSCIFVRADASIQ